MINFVTITGADNSIQPEDLLALSEQFPGTELGILLSKNSQGMNRFPSYDWLLKLAQFKHTDSAYRSLKLSGHICGSWVRELLMGKTEVIGSLTRRVWDIFDRFQLNTHGQPHPYFEHALHRLRNDNPQVQWIFQMDNKHVGLVPMAKSIGLNCAALHDLSHGAGIVPQNWPDLIDGVYNGYAGGLGPDNLRQQLPLIEQKAADTRIWVDMETHVRSNSDRQFDLDLVKEALTICQGFMPSK